MTDNCAMGKNWLDSFIKRSRISSQEELADELGLSRATINRLANNHDQLKRPRAEAIAAVLECSVEDLMLNRQPEDEEIRPPQMKIVSSFDPDEPESEDDGEGHSYSRDHWRPKVGGAIPEIDIKLGAGHGSVGEVINLPVGNGNVSGHRVISEWLIPVSYLRDQAGAAPNQSIISEIIGDSMMPTYMPGDKVIVDLSQNQFVSDTVYAISDGYSEPQIKRLQRIPFSDPAQVRIISDNPALETFTVELHRLKIIGRICGHIARK